MSNQITEIEKSIASEIQVDQKGHGFISGRGLARLLGVSQPLFTDKQMASKTRQILIAQGFEPDKIAASGYPDVVLPAIASYYGYAAKQTSEQARQVSLVLGAIGARTWMQKVAGWEKPKGMVKLPKEEAERMILCLQAQVNLKAHIENFPGYMEIVDQGEATGAVPEGEDPLTLITTLLDQWGVKYNNRSLSAIGMYVATQYRNAKHKKPIRKRTKPVVGKRGWSQANYYPESWLIPVLRNALKAINT